MEEKKEHEHHKKNITNQIRENPWMLATILLAILCLILLIFTFTGNFTGKTISSIQAGEYLVEFFETQGILGLGVESVKTENGFYVANILYEGQVFPFYITKNGYLIGESLQSIVPIKSTTSTTSISKSNKPSAELYIWSYCPYGVTALAPFADVAKLLGNFADFKVYLYYAGHGDYEEQQNKIQACIQELNYDYWDYAKTFANEIYEKCYGDADCDLKESVALMNSLGIDSAKVLSCVDSQGSTLIKNDYDTAGNNGVTGSPTLIINGAKVSVSRTAEAYKGAVCSAFNNVPSECSQTLDSTGSTATGNC